MRGKNFYTGFVAFMTTVFLLFSLGSGILVYAAQSSETSSSDISAGSEDEAKLLKIEREWEQYQKDIDQKYSDRIQKNQDRIEELRTVLETNLLEFDSVRKQTEANEDAVEMLQGRITTLNGQLENLSRSLINTKAKIRIIEEQIAVKESDLAKVMEEKEKILSEADYQKEIVLSYFSLLQTEADSIGNTNENGLRIILTNDSFTKNLRDEMNFSAMEKTARQLFHDLEGAMAQLEEVDYLLSQEKTTLSTLHGDLENERKILAIQYESEDAILKETAGEENRFQKLLKESQDQMANSAREIADVKDDMAFLREKINLLEVGKMSEKSKVTKDRIEEALQNDDNYVLDDLFIVDEADDKPFSWPVPPEKITATFKDSAYQGTFGIVHNAVDIRAKQGTAIAAPAAGYVYKVVDNGMGYSYLILIHRDNLMTVYGHIPEFNVVEGDIVQQGDIVAYTGGTPGTKGAGLMTTGPHLHFEVWEGGEAKNPLDYLPIDELNPEDVPREYVVEDFLESDKTVEDTENTETQPLFETTPEELNSELMDAFQEGVSEDTGIETDGSVEEGEGAIDGSGISGAEEITPQGEGTEASQPDEEGTVDMEGNMIYDMENIDSDMNFEESLDEAFDESVDGEEMVVPETTGE